MSDEEIQRKAIEFAKQNKTQIAKKLTDRSVYPPDDSPVSVFMAGSPGAGKTEFSKSLIEVIEKYRSNVVRIDGDEVRRYFPDYTGRNSYLFQGAISIIIDKTHDLVLRQKQNFILDGTFWKYEKASENVRRSLDKSRRIFVFYVYQAPQVAWRFTQAREKVEGRNIPKQAFVDQFIGARDTVERIISEFGQSVVVFLVKKDFEKHTVEDLVEIKPEGSQIDDYIPERYTPDELKNRL